MFTEEQLAAAEDIQRAAIKSTCQLVHITAGPGTGKSRVLVSKVLSALDQGIQPEKICVVSFTRNSASDIGKRIGESLVKAGRTDSVHASTLHALAFRILVKASSTDGLSNFTVLDKWEIEKIFDPEFGISSGIDKHTGLTQSGKRKGNRWEEIRRYFEAYWCSSESEAAVKIRQSGCSVITDAEKSSFLGFKRRFRELYDSFLPGESVYECVERCESGAIDVQKAVPLELLLVDEAQDLNQVDFRLIDLYVRSGTAVFIVGDDDQSIYGFRYAHPESFRSFASQANVSAHFLKYCFRCTPAVLNAAQAVVKANCSSRRRKEEAESLYCAAEPPISGVLKAVKFRTGVSEAEGLVRAILDLNQAGVPLEEMLILVSSLGSSAAQSIAEEMEKNNIGLTQQSGKYLDEDCFRAFYAILRWICEESRPIALRTLWQLMDGIGPGKRKKLENFRAAYELSFTEAASGDFAENVSKDKSFSALEVPLVKVKSLLSSFHELNENASLEVAKARLMDGLQTALPTKDAALAELSEFIASIRTSLSLGEILRAIQSTRSLEELRASISSAAPDDETASTAPECEGNGERPSVRMLTIHGSKGLEASVVFIPGLEEGGWPSVHASGIPELVEESARALYVGITRAKLACFLSCAESRQVNGQFAKQSMSRFGNAISPWVSASSLVDSEESLEIGRIIQQL